MFQDKTRHPSLWLEGVKKGLLVVGRNSLYLYVDRYIYYVHVQSSKVIRRLIGCLDLDLDAVKPRGTCN